MPFGVSRRGAALPLLFVAALLAAVTLSLAFSGSAEADTVYESQNVGASERCLDGGSITGILPGVRWQTGEVNRFLEVFGRAQKANGCNGAQFAVYFCEEDANVRGRWVCSFVNSYPTRVPNGIYNSRKTYINCIRGYDLASGRVRTAWKFEKDRFSSRGWHLGPTFTIPPQCLD